MPCIFSHVERVESMQGPINVHLGFRGQLRHSVVPHPLGRESNISETLNACNVPLILFLISYCGCVFNNS